MNVLDDSLTMVTDKKRDTLNADMPRDWPGAGRSRLVDAGGITWHVQRHGDTGPTMLLLHGAGASLHSWADIVPLAAKRFRVLTIDLPGHGFTQAFPAGPFTITRTAGKIASLLDTLDVSPDLMIGHSAGAAIAMQMSVDAGVEWSAERQIVAINPAVLPFSGLAGIAFPAMAKIAAGSGFLAGLIASRASDEAQVKRLIAGTGSRIGPAGLRRYQFLMRRPEHVSAVLSMMAGWQLDHLLPALRRINPPMHFVIGDLDRAVPPVRTMTVARQLSNTQATRFADVGHLAHEEQPQKIYNAIVGALPAELAARR